jgi:flagellum-specific peptidoglycan hydrolase FlgJ
MLLSDVLDAIGKNDSVGMLGLNNNGNSFVNLLNGLSALIGNYNNSKQTTDQVATQPVDDNLEQTYNIRGQQPNYSPYRMKNVDEDFASQDKRALLTQLKEEVKKAYPDNPTLQQVALTQAILESNLMGKPSVLASRYNNLFGIKASNSFPGTAGNVNMPTNEVYGGKTQRVNAGFARNATLGDSFMQHRDLLTGSRRYMPVINANDPYEAFAALQQAGYATDPAYERKLNRVYENYIAPLYASAT